MADNDLELKFSANASGVTEGADQAKGAINSIGVTVKALSDLLLEMGGIATGSFREIRTGAVEAGEQVKGVAEGVVELREAIAGFGEALIAAFAVEQIAEFAEKMGEAAEKTLHTAETFGLTVAEVQRMNAEAALFGVPAEALTTGMQRLDKSFAAAKSGATQQALAFKEVGINVQGAYTQTELMNAALEGLAKMEAGPAKVAAAMAVFGRNIQAIGPLLGLTEEQIAETGQKIEEYGAVNEDAAAKGVALAESFNTNKLAGMGLNNVFTDALAPALKSIVDGVNDMAAAFIHSYQEGGTAKTVMDALSWTIKAVADVVGLFGAMAVYTFDTVDGAIWMFQAAFNPLVDAVAAGCKAMIDAFKTLGDVIRDVLTLNWSAIGGDIRSGMARISADVANTARQMGADSAKAFHQGAEEWMAGDKAVAGYEAWSKKMWSGAGSKAELPKEGTGTTSDIQTKPKKAKGGAEGDSELQQWEAELQDKKLAENNFWNDDLAGEAAFWQSKLAILEAETGGTKAEINKRAGEIRTIRQKIFDDEKTLANQERNENLAKIAEEVKTQIDGENTKYKVTIDGIRERQEAVRAAAQRGEINPQQELAQLEALNAQEVAAEKAKADAIYQINLQGLKEKEALYATDPVNLKKTQDLEAQLALIHQNQLTQIAAKGEQDRAKLEQQAATQTEQLWRQRVGSVVQSFGQQMQGLINGTMTFRQAIMNVFQSIETALFRAVERMVTNWIAGQIAQRTATVASVESRVATEQAGAAQSMAIHGQQALKQIVNDAAKAASGAYNAMVGIPIIGPVIAPPAAAAAFAGVMAFEGMVASAAGGYDIPAGVNPMVQAHAQEMILPASIANPMRSMIANYGGATTNNSSAGDTHVHYHAPDVNQHGMDLPRALDAHASDVVRFFERAARDGKLKTTLKLAGAMG